MWSHLNNPRPLHHWDEQLQLITRGALTKHKLDSKDKNETDKIVVMHVPAAKST
jgi:hypothetical protein